MASAADKLKRTSNGGIPAIATVQAARTAGVTTLSVDTQQFWPDNTMTGVAFSTYKVDTNNKKIAGSQIDWSGVSNGTNALSGLVRVGGATDTGNAIGDKVQMGPTAKWAEDVIEGFGNQHSLVDGTHGNITATGYSQASGTFAAPNGAISVKTLNNPVNFKAYRNGLWSTTGAFTIVPYETALWDSGSNFNVSTHTFTAPFPGFYQFIAKCAVTAGASAISPFMELQWNHFAGGNDIIFGPVQNITAGNTSVVGVVETLELLAGDTIQGGIIAPVGLTGGTGIGTTIFSGKLENFS